MEFSKKDNHIFYHVNLNKKMLSGATTALLPGDPGRVEKTACIIDSNAYFLASNREYTSWLADLEGHKILVCSTGIGGPSVSICIEELAALGIKRFIRIGTTGSIQERINLADMIITTGSVRLDGASSQYAPLEYPAVADIDLTAHLIQAAKNLNIPFHKGISASCDTFYPGQERYDTFSGYVPKRFQGSLEEWKHLNVLNYEMESSTIFIMCSVFGLKGAMISSVIVKREDDETPEDTIIPLAEKRLAECVKEALKNSFKD
jgi:uridine phosphorylase